MNNQQDATVQSTAVIDERVRRVELLISNLLRVGVITSIVLIVIGTILTFAQHPAYLSSPVEQQRLAAPDAKSPHSLADLIGGLRELRGEIVVTLGLLVLIATPVMRVAVSIFAFIYQGDRVFTLITAGVFLLLLLSLILGRAG